MRRAQSRVLPPGPHQAAIRVVLGPVDQLRKSVATAIVLTLLLLAVLLLLSAYGRAV